MVIQTFKLKNKEYEIQYDERGKISILKDNKVIKEGNNREFIEFLVYYFYLLDRHGIKF